MKSYLPIVGGALVYGWLLYQALNDPVSAAGFGGGGGNGNPLSIDNLVKGFSSETSVAVAWAHFIAQDIFVGRWVYLDGLKNRIWTSHSLVLCFLFGPLGALSHLVTRGIVKYGFFQWNVQDIMEGGGGVLDTDYIDEMERKSTKKIEQQKAKIISKAEKEADQMISQAKIEAIEVRNRAEKLLEEAEKLLRKRKGN